jgi:hypothetical protein
MATEARPPLEELQKAGLDPKKHPACAPQIISEGVTIQAGCSRYEECTFKFKGKGAKYLKVRTLKKNGKLKEYPLRCYDWWMRHAPDNQHRTGDIHKIVGFEGEKDKEGNPITYLAMETTPNKRVENGTILVSHEPVVVKREIPKMPTIQTDPELAGAAYSGRLRIAEEEDAFEASVAERLGKKQRDTSLLDDEPPIEALTKGVKVVESKPAPDGSGRK